MSQLFAIASEFLRFSGRRSVTAFLFMTLGGLVESLGILLLVPIIALLSGTQGDLGLGWFGRSVAEMLQGLTPGERISGILGLFVAVIIVRAAILWKRDMLLAQLRLDYVADVRARLVRATASAGWGQIAKVKHVKVADAISNEVDRCGNALHAMLQVGVGTLMLVFQIAVSVILSPLLTLFAVGSLSLTALTLRPALTRARKTGSAFVGAHIQIATETIQFLAGLKSAYAQNIQSRHARRLEEGVLELSGLELSFSKQQTAARLAFTTVGPIVGALLIGLSFAYLDVPTPILIALVILFGRMAAPALQVQQAIQRLSHGVGAFAAVGEVFRDLGSSRFLPELAEPAAEAAAAPDRGGVRIEFRDVSFQHRDEGGAVHAALHGISLVIPEGQIVGLTGPSGAGKTTLVDLMLHLYRPAAGEILVDGEALSQPALLRFRNSAAYVSQNEPLLHDTIHRNLLWTSSGGSDAEIRHVLELAGADRFVDNLPEGLETVVGDRGTLISGGERQRLCLARALLRTPRLLILDEATSALDLATEAEVLARLRNLPFQPTIVLVSHRLESLAWCDRVIGVEAGRLVTDLTGQDKVGEWIAGRVRAEEEYRRAEGAAAMGRGA